MIYTHRYLISYWLLANLDPRLRHSGTSLAGLALSPCCAGAYKKDYRHQTKDYRLFWRVQHQIMATAYLVRDDSCGSPLYDVIYHIWVVLYHKTGEISRQFVKNVRDTALDTRDKRLQTQDARPPAEKQRRLNRG